MPDLESMTTAPYLKHLDAVHRAGLANNPNWTTLNGLVIDLCQFDAFVDVRFQLRLEAQRYLTLHLDRHLQLLESPNCKRHAELPQDLVEFQFSSPAPSDILSRIFKSPPPYQIFLPELIVDRATIKPPIAGADFKVAIEIGQPLSAVK